MKDFWIRIVAVMVLLGVMLSKFLLFATVYGCLFTLLGFHYTSVTAVLAYFAFYLVLNMPLNIAVKSFITTLFVQGLIRQPVYIYACLDVIISTTLFYTVGQLLEEISVTLLSCLVFSLSLTIYHYLFKNN